MAQGGTSAGGQSNQGWHNTRKMKADDELQIVWGEVYVPGFPDSQGDFMTADEVRKMAYEWLVKGETTTCIDVNHDGQCYKAEVVESFIARKSDPDFIAGSWVVGIHIGDVGLWGRVKKGELNGLSMEALVTSVPVELDIDMPEIIDGLTMKAEDGHQHTYKVQFDRSGNIIGGETNYVNGHRHIIKRGTITEEAGSPSHKHRYSFLDNVQLSAA